MIIPDYNSTRNFPRGLASQIASARATTGMKSRVCAWRGLRVAPNGSEPHFPILKERFFGTDTILCGDLFGKARVLDLC